jgi:plasmid stabilization system protein ParE
MIRFTVTWLRGAQNHLADLWTGSADRSAVARAADAIDAELAVDAHLKGAPVSEGLRTLHIPPLHVLFSVSEPDRTVEVASVRSDEVPPPNPQTNGKGPSAEGAP